jgi:hypothetical protein
MNIHSDILFVAGILSLPFAVRQFVLPGMKLGAFLALPVPLAFDLGAWAVILHVLGHRITESMSSRSKPNICRSAIL